MLNTSLEVVTLNRVPLEIVISSSSGLLVQLVEHSADNRKIQVQVLEGLLMVS